MKSVIFRGLRLPLCIIGFLLLFSAFLAMPLYLGYFGMCLMATNNLGNLLALLHPGLFWAFILHHSIMMSVSMALGIKFLCQMIELDNQNQRGQANFFASIAGAIAAALSGAILLKTGSILLPLLHLPSDVLHGPLAWFCEPVDNMVSGGSLLADDPHDSTFFLVLLLYGMGWVLGSKLPAFRQRQILRGAEPASYHQLREAVFEPNRPERNSPRMK